MTISGCIDGTTQPLSHFFDLKDSEYVFLTVSFWAGESGGQLLYRFQRAPRRGTGILLFSPL